MLIAVDFDGTLCQGGKPNRELFDYLLQKQKDGWKIVLWSCRKGKRLSQAVEFCRREGLEFFDVHEGKQQADLYIDDLAKRPEEVTNGLF